ncbi:MAG: TetR/AcrR family transcriptional regulator [Maritimibacter sp.]
MSQEKPHHHGDLRAAILKAAITVLNEQGAEALSIRKLAASIGVSHAAPAHHFPSLAHLRTALHTEGHIRFAAAMQQGRAEAEDTPRAQALGTAIGYLRFARCDPGLFNMMFGGPPPHDAEDETYCTAGTHSREILRDIARPFAHGPKGALGTELLIWSIAHGFARLSIGGEPSLTDESEAIAMLSAIFPDLPTT